MTFFLRIYHFDIFFLCIYVRLCGKEHLILFIWESISFSFLKYFFKYGIGGWWLFSLSPSICFHSITASILILEFTCQCDYNLSLGNLLFSLEEVTISLFFCLFYGILKFPYVSRYVFHYIIASWTFIEISEFTKYLHSS